MRRSFLKWIVGLFCLQTFLAHVLFFYEGELGISLFWLDGAPTVELLLAELSVYSSS